MKRVTITSKGDKVIMLIKAVRVATGRCLRLTGGCGPCTPTSSVRTAGRPTRPWSWSRRATSTQGWSLERL